MPSNTTRLTVTLEEGTSAAAIEGIIEQVKGIHGVADCVDPNAEMHKAIENFFAQLGESIRKLSSQGDSIPVKLSEGSTPYDGTPSEKLAQEINRNDASMEEVIGISLDSDRTLLSCGCVRRTTFPRVLDSVSPDCVRHRSYGPGGSRDPLGRPSPPKSKP